MAQEFNFIPTEISMKGCSSRAKEMDRALTTFQTARSTKESGAMGKLKDLESANGLMGEFTKATGLIQKKMESEYTNGPTADCTKATIVTTKSTAKELMCGRTEESMLESGKMIKDMARESTLSARNKAKKAFGKKMNESIGSTSDSINIYLSYL